MKTRIYLDTSVFGAICDVGLEERLVATRHVLDGLVEARWDGFISTLVLEEIDRAPEIVRKRIAQELRRSGVLREGFGLLDIVSPWEIVNEEA